MRVRISVSQPSMVVGLIPLATLWVRATVTTGKSVKGDLEGRIVVRIGAAIQSPAPPAQPDEMFGVRNNLEPMGRISARIARSHDVGRDEELGPRPPTSALVLSSQSSESSRVAGRYLCRTLGRRRARYDDVLLTADHVANDPTKQAAAHCASNRSGGLVFLARKLVAGDAACNGTADGADVPTR